MMINCSFQKLVPVSLLVAHPQNANQHSSKQIEMLAKILKYQGWRHPIVVSGLSGHIVAGHGRLAAAKINGWEEVPVDVQNFSDKAQELAFLLSDNFIAELAETDNNMLETIAIELGDFDHELLGLLEPIELTEEEDHRDGDGAGNPPDREISKLGDVYQLGRHTLMCGDATDTRALNVLFSSGFRPDMVFTDPPYGVDVVKSDMVGADFGVAEKGKYKEIIGDNTTDCAEKFYKTLKDMGFRNFILWGGNYFTKFLEPKNSWVVWNKRADTGITNTFADCELAWSDIGFPVRMHSQLWNGMIRSGEKDKRVHPTQKPVALAEFCFSLLKNCKTVFDGFGGSGSTLIACEKTDRQCFMMELDPHYVDVIVSRYCKFVNNYEIMRNGEKIDWPQGE